MRVPVSTYRLQFRREFRFADAQALVPYLRELGITDCYSSPHLLAVPGSSHGYDICDHGRLNPEIGTEAEYESFTSELQAHGMGQIVDFVPNHMGADPVMNGWWRDVLENGRCSPYADFFDIDWNPVKAELAEKILLPVLGDQYGVVLERGELKVVYHDGTFTLRYFDHDLPINPRQHQRILACGVDSLRKELGEDDPELLEYLSIMTALGNLPRYTETERSRVAERHREKEVARERLHRLAGASPRIRRHVEEAVRIFNGNPGEPASFDLLHDLLEEEPYRLAYWRTASHEINYRRFFDINQLAGLRTEVPNVFAAAHELIFRLIGTGQITGLRLDHTDGLFDPAGYLEQLQRAIGEQTDGERLHVVVEKILSRGESLPLHWPIAGTTGYEFLNDVNGLFVDRERERKLLRAYHRFTGQSRPYEDILYESKKLIMETSMASELNVLAHALNHISERNRRTRDFTLNSLREALREVVATFHLYRTYVTHRGHSDADRDAIDSAIRAARRRNPAVEPTIFRFLRGVLLPSRTDLSADAYQERVTFAQKFQQYTGPVEAKGREDTSFYRYYPLTSLNEVGGDPARFGCSPDDFHTENRYRQEHWPNTMLASATHDTKRGEDVRARINVLSELPEEWGRQLSTWARINAGNRTLMDGQPAPDRNDEYLFYQTLLGIWPPGVESADDESLTSRLQAYLLKTAREAKVHTSWLAEDADYEAGLAHFVEATLRGPTAKRFLTAFLPFQRRVAQLGMLSSLSSLVLKATSPGVPDFYQGTELWDLSLVDPDNRRPVDFETRRRALATILPCLGDQLKRAGTVRDMLANWRDGRIKLYLTASLLRFRREQPATFASGVYEPLEPTGEQADHLVAFARRHENRCVTTVVPRLVAALGDTAGLPLGTDFWGATRLRMPAGVAAYTNLFTGETVGVEEVEGVPTVSISSVFATCPVAVLVS
jgi:(1->4)-alpha-D-glucan 1-alpha-D-glucosylmutase